MQLGFAVPTAGSWATPDRMVELATRAEQLDYASLWTFQRLLFPADEAEAANPRWQPVYRSVHDPLDSALVDQEKNRPLGLYVSPHSEYPVPESAGTNSGASTPRPGVIPVR